MSLQIIFLLWTIYLRFLRAISPHQCLSCPALDTREGNGKYCCQAVLQCSCLENPMDGGACWAAVHGVAKSRTWLSDFTFTFPFHALEKEMAAHSSVLAWRIPGMGEPGGLTSMGSHRVGHDWSDLAAAEHWQVLLINAGNENFRFKRRFKSVCPLKVFKPFT